MVTGRIELQPANRTSTAADSHPVRPANVARRAPAPLRVTTDASAAEWDAYILQHPAASVDHLWAWRDIFSGVFKHEPVYLVARRGPQVTGVLPLVQFRSRLFGKFVVSLPFLNYGGVVADDGEAAAALVDRAVDAAREFGASHVELRHVQRQCPELPCRTHKLALSRPLPAPGADLWAHVDRKVRNQVRKAQKEGLVATEGGGELVDEFYSVFARNMRDLGTPVYSRRLFDETFRLFADRARAFVVRQGTRPLAAGVLLRFRDTVLVPWASSLREFRHLCPNMLLYWTMLESSMAAGASTFDFGRSSPGGGTHQFKLQWGASETPMHWEYVLLSRQGVPDHGPTNQKFHAAIEVWRRLPLGLAGRIGPLVSRHLS